MRPNTDFQVEVTEEQIAMFLENGFVSINRIAIDEELEWLKRVYD